METPIEVEDQNQEKNQGTGAEKDFVNEGSENKDENAHGTRSLVWEHFTYVKGQTKFKCPYCKKKLKYVSKNGTQGLKNHLENTCRTSPLLKKTKGDTKKQSVLSLKPTVKGEGSLTAHSFSEKNCRKALAKMCIKDNRPFSVVDDEGFKEYSLEFNLLMLETAVQYVDAFERMKLVDYQFKSYFCCGDEDECESNTKKRKRKETIMGPPEAMDWENARQFIEYLRVFYNVTNLKTGSKYVTSNIFFGELVTMHASISQMCASVDEKKKKMACSMKAKYDKYWENMDNMNPLLYVAVVVDPRNKMCFLEWCLGEIYGINSPKIKEICDRVIRTLNELYYRYKLKAEKEGGGSKGQSSSSKSMGPLILTLMLR